MKRVIKESVLSSKNSNPKNATFKTDRRLSPTSERYKGYLIVLDRGGDGYNVYDKHRELEDAGYPSREAAKKFIDELESSENIISSIYFDEFDESDDDYDDLIINKTYITLSDYYYDTVSNLHEADWDEVIDVFESNNWISRDDLIIPKGTKMTLSDVDNYYNIFEVHTSHGTSYIPIRLDECDGLFREVTDSEIYSSTSYGNDLNDEDHNSYSFMNGDKIEWSGLYSGQYKGVVTDVNDEYVTVDVTWIAEDTGDIVTNTQKFEITTDSKGKKCIIVWTYGDYEGYVYPPSCDNVNSAEAVDNSEREFQRIDRSVTSSETFDAHSYAKQRKQSSEFNKWLKRVESAILRNDTTRIKNIKESLMYMTSSQLSNKLTSYLIDKLNSALTTSSDDIKSASYGGAFDIGDDQFFTKDEIVEFGNTVCDHLNETLHDTYDVSDVYMETPKKLVLTVVQQSDESEFTATIDIDVRKIKKPADLTNRYLGDVVDALQQDIKAYNDGINASSDITSISSNDIIANTITNQLPPAVDMFLMDIAQIYGEFSYSDISKHRFSDSEIKQLQNLRRRYFKYAEFDDEDKIQSIIDNVNKIVLGDSLNASTDITAAIKSNVDLLKTKIWNAASAEMEDMGFPVDEIPDYLFVEIEQADDHIRVEVRAEVSYEGIENLITSIDPVIQEYDKDAYFEPAEPGIAEAYIWNVYNITSSETVEAAAYDIPDRPLDPPEDDWKPLDSDDEIIELTLDAIVRVNEDGTWEYDDAEYPWAMSPNNPQGDWYTSDYGIYIGDKTTIVEYVDQLLEPMMPFDKGQYHIQGDVTLIFSVEGIQVKRDYFDDEHEGISYNEDAYIDEAETTFLYDKSHVDNFEVTEH